MPNKDSWWKENTSYHYDKDSWFQQDNSCYHDKDSWWNEDIKMDENCI